MCGSQQSETVFREETSFLVGKREGKKGPQVAREV